MNFLQSLTEQEDWNGGQGPIEQIAPAPKDMKQTSPKKTLMHMLYRTQAEEEEVSSQHDSLIKFFQDNPSPSEDEMNTFADQLGTDPDALDERIYALLSSLLKGVGKHNDTPDAEFDADELAKGIEIEMEHTEDELIAKMIAKDHLSEIPDYYNRLGQMEDEAGDEANVDAEMDMGPDEEMDAVDDEMDAEREYHDDEEGMSDEEDMDVEMDMDPDEIGDDLEDEDDMEPDFDADLDDDELDDEDEYDDDELDDEDEYDDDELDDEDEYDDDELDDEDDESEYESGDLEDDEFEVSLGQVDDEEDRPRKKKKHVKRLTFKESLING